MTTDTQLTCPNCAESNLNTSEVRTKSNHGGKRKGAGRPQDPGSIRSVLHHDNEVARRERGEHAYISGTKYQIEIETYVQRNAHRLVYVLSHFPDKDHFIFGADDDHTRRTFISRRDAYRIAHEPREDHVMFLVMLHRAAIEKFIRQYSNDPHWLSVKSIAQAKEYLQGYEFEFPEETAASSEVGAEK